MSATDELLANNDAYAASFSDGDKPLPPATGVAVLACMDARLDVHGLLGLNVGDAHVIRNAGGVVSDTGIRPHFALEAFADLDDDVRQSIARVQASPFLVHKDSVRGFVYDVSTGRLREVG